VRHAGHCLCEANQLQNGAMVATHAPAAAAADAAPPQFFIIRFITQMRRLNVIVFIIADKEVMISPRLLFG